MGSLSVDYWRTLFPHRTNLPLVFSVPIGIPGTHSHGVAHRASMALPFLGGRLRTLFYTGLGGLGA